MEREGEETGIIPVQRHRRTGSAGVVRRGAAWRGVQCLLCRWCCQRGHYGRGSPPVGHATQPINGVVIFDRPRFFRLLLTACSTSPGRVVAGALSFALPPSPNPSCYIPSFAADSHSQRVQTAQVGTNIRYSSKTRRPAIDETNSFSLLRKFNEI